MTTRVGTYYLNNRGSRWIVLVNGKRERLTFLTTSGAQIVRTVNYYSSFGNFVTGNISYKGRKMSVFLDIILKD